MPVNIFRPRGFGGGYDHRFTKAFQPGTSQPIVDPTPNVRELHATNVTFKPHMHAEDGGVRHHLSGDQFRVVPHVFGMDLEIYKVG